MGWFGSKKKDDDNPDQDAATRPDTLEPERESKSVFSVFSRKKNKVEDAKELEIIPDVKDDLDLPLGTPMADSGSPALSPISPQKDGARYSSAAAEKNAEPVRVKAKLVNAEWEDSESSEDEKMLERMKTLHKNETQDVRAPTQRKKKAFAIRFERRKKRIASRFQTRRELAEFVKTEGAQVGGQWVDQKWVSNKTLNLQKDQFTISKWAKDLSIYLLFLFSFTYIIFTSSGYGEFVAYQNSWRNMLQSRAMRIKTPDSSIFIIEQIVLEDLVAGRRTYFDGYDAPGGKGEAGQVLLGSIMVGDIRLRQQRVIAKPCTKVGKMLQNFGMVKSNECYPPYTKLTEEKLYTKEENFREEFYDDEENYPYFTYKSPFETAFGETKGDFGLYDAGGFVVSFDLKNASNTLSVLKELQWIDKKTRVFFMDFSFYNDDLGLFISCKIVVEFVSSQAPVVTVDASGISPMRFGRGSSNEVTRLAMMVLCFVLVIYYVIEELDKCRDSGVDHFKSISWAWLDLSNLALFVLSGCLTGYNLVAYEIAIPDDIPGNDLLDRIKALGQSQYLNDKIQGLNGFFLWFKLFKHVTVTRRIMVMGRVLADCLPDIITFVFFFFIVLVAFSVLGYLFCGNQLQTFSSIEFSMLSILRSMYGDFDFDALVEVSGITGFIYLASWLITSNIILLNMFIAILSEAYRKVGEEERDHPTETTFQLIVEDYERRKAESKKLREEAFALYGGGVRKKKGRFESFYRWAYKKMRGKELPEEVLGEGEDEEEQSQHDSEDQDPDEADEASRLQKQKLADLDWTPWDTHIDPSLQNRTEFFAQESLKQNQAAISFEESVQSKS